MRRDDLPVNAIDTGVILEALIGKPSDLRHDCERYLLRSGQLYRPALSAALAHELVALAMAKEKEVSDRILDALLGLIRNPDTRLLPPQWSTFERVLALRELDSRLQPLDAFHIASAIDAKVRVFVTLDPLLLKSEALKRELPVYVLHPRMLLGRQPR